MLSLVHLSVRRRFLLSPRSMTLDDVEGLTSYKLKFSRNFAEFRSLDLEANNG